MGQASRIDRLEVRWPSGTVDVFENLEVNQILTLLEGKGIASREPFRTPTLVSKGEPGESDSTPQSSQ
ncbi:MAG: ASPIC/UnbV domain-containing protein, partial [Chloroflexi bacterium]|nr:ASPIC/UnbV domain-containing protein [Chloroflexota bacterium]